MAQFIDDEHDDLQKKNVIFQSGYFTRGYIMVYLIIFHYPIISDYNPIIMPINPCKPYDL